MNHVLKKYLTLLLITMFIVVFLYVIYIGVNQIQFHILNAPLWSSEKSVLDSKTIIVNEKQDIKLIIDKKNIFLKYGRSNRVHVLFSNYKTNYKSIKLYLKDLNQDKQDEILLLVNGKDLYVYSDLQATLIKYQFKRDFISAGMELFFSDDEMYVRSCGSQYCNDDYYYLSNNQLSVRNTDIFESW